MYRKLNLDRDKVDRCRDIARRIAAPVLRYLSHHSSVSIERATFALLNLDPGCVDRLTRDQLRRGACSWIEGEGREALTKRAREAVRRLDDLRAKADPVSMRLARLRSPGENWRTPEEMVPRIFDAFDGEPCDPIAQTLFGNINVKRALLDSQFVRKLFARSGLIARTREDELLGRLDAYRHGHQALASLFLNEQFALATECPPELFGVTVSFAIDSSIESSVLLELAFIQVVRELFLRNPIFYTLRGDLSASRRALFHTVGTISEMNVRLGDHDTDMFSNAFHDVGDELLINPNGLISRRAHTVLENTFKLLQRIEGQGLLEAMASGIFADVACVTDGGEGLDGVFQKERGYWNPILELLAEEPDVIPEPEVTPVAEKKSAPQPAAPKNRGRRRRRGRGGRSRQRTPAAPATAGGT